jgi:hypothetical protein
MPILFSAAKAPFLARFKMRYCGVENVERIALEAYQNMPNEQENAHANANGHKGHQRKHSKSKNLLNFSPSHSANTTSHEVSPILTALARDNFTGGAGSCAETISWKAAIFKVHIISFQNLTFSLGW